MIRPAERAGCNIELKEESTIRGQYQMAPLAKSAFAVDRLAGQPRSVPEEQILTAQTTGPIPPYIRIQNNQRKEAGHRNSLGQSEIMNLSNEFSYQKNPNDYMTQKNLNSGEVVRSVLTQHKQLPMAAHPDEQRAYLNIYDERELRNDHVYGKAEPVRQRSED